MPTIVASPFTPRMVVSEPFEHTSILKTIAERWDLELPAAAGPRLPRVKSLWDSCFEFSRSRGRAGKSIAVPSVTADGRTQIPPDGTGPVKSDMAESLVKATQISSLAEVTHYWKTEARHPGQGRRGAPIPRLPLRLAPPGRPGPFLRRTGGPTPASCRSSRLRLDYRPV